MTGPRSIAIVSVAGRFPGAASVGALWENVVANRSSAGDVAPGRWPVPASDVVASAAEVEAEGISDKAFSSRGCSLGAVELDPSGLDLPASLLPRLGRLARLTLQVGREAWRGVRTTVDPLRVRVILANIALPTDGASAFAEELFLAEADTAVDGRAAPRGTDPLEAFPSALPAGLLARALGFGGGSFTLDAACASSLYAIHLACADLEARRADAVLAGGVSLAQSMYTQVGFSQLQALSKSGRCVPYDEAADGLVVGEGAAMVVLRRLDDARRDGDVILGVIRGVGLSNDVGGSLLSPDSEGQLRAMRAAYAQAGFAPGDVDLVEGHGTGTPRGDAVEIASLTSLWRDASPGARACVLGSVKGNVGHLLTAAGVTGLSKVLQALSTKVLPPSVSAGTACTALAGSPFRVIRAAEPWGSRGQGIPRRAAVSGFGFGGINAHLLVEEADPLAASTPATAASEPCPVAIVGLGVHVGRLGTLAAFEAAMFRGEVLDDARPPDRWHGLEDRDGARRLASVAGLRGGWIDAVTLAAGRFRLAPRDVPSVLPQQLLMMEVAAAALDDAGWVRAGPQLRTGAVIGLGLDLETTSFHLRWLARARVRAWARSLGLSLSQGELDAWAEELRDALAPPLDATRTLGALGGIVPSRIAREFHLGGPSFAVADDEASGLRALEVAVRMLQRGEADAMLAGAVDLAGDVRAVVAKDALRPYSRSGRARPFDARADGAAVAEGAAAVVLKRLDDAVRSGDRIYAVVRGVGAAGGAPFDGGRPREDAYVRAAEAAYLEAGIARRRVGLVEAHASGDAALDALEARALARLFGDAPRRSTPTIALSSVAGTVGQAGAAAGMLSVVKAALSLRGEILSPLGDIDVPTSAIDWHATPFHFPRAPLAWLRDRAGGPRVAAVSSMGEDGSCLHAVLEGYEGPSGPSRALAPPFAARGTGLFLLRRGRDGAADLARLREVAGRAPGVDAAAVAWFQGSRQDGSLELPVARAIVAESLEELRAELASPAPPTSLVQGELAIVFPGSGNQYVGMGRGLSLALPEVYRALDAEVTHLAGHLQPGLVAPYRSAWDGAWEEEARRELLRAPERTIVAQVAHGIAVHDALRYLGVVPDAYLGYSLGESASLLASRTWRDRDLLFARTVGSPLFRSELAGERTVFRAAHGADAVWCVAIVNRAAEAVAALRVGTVALLIVNAPGECVIGGTAEDLAATVARLGCGAVPLDGVPTVHLPLVRAVEGAYRAHHTLPSTPPRGVRIYSGAWARAYDPTEANAASSVTDNAVHGFDFPAVVERAYADGVRVFVEAGPQGSCTRMIGRILAGRPHLAVSACARDVDGFRSLLVAVARLAASGVPVDLSALYGDAASLEEPRRTALLAPVVLGGRRRPMPLRSGKRTTTPVRTASPSWDDSRESATRSAPPPDLAAFFAAEAATAAAHETFLKVSAEAMALHTRLLRDLQPSGLRDLERAAPTVPIARFDRDACLELAVGKLANVLGRSFADVDAFPTRVRLPDEPLMLVDRIVSVEGEMGVLGPGRVVTEHDVHPSAWYLDGGRAPVCISVEAGQADLFLSGYLGIDRETRGERVYRLLDAKIVFHRDLPEPGERIRYDIRIDRFIRQGDTWLFFFRFDGTIDGAPFITMFDGCAGFFSATQLGEGRGIVPRAGDATRAPVPLRPGAEPFAPLVTGAPSCALAASQLAALRAGDLEAAFGAAFAGKTLAPGLRLPGGRMTLVDRIVSLDAAGGRAGLGEVVGEADVHPDAWYLVCHFIDDQVMPGTLMYECCLHTLRVLLLRLGWVTSGAADGVHYAPIAGIASELRCRGQVTASTRTVRYKVTIDAIGYHPEPFVHATAAMYADDKHVVQMDRMSVELRGVTRAHVEAEWRPAEVVAPAFSRAQIVAYAEGKPSECFGDRYRPFDELRRLARLPRDPYLFVDRVLSVAQRPWVMEAVEHGGWVTCAFDVDPDAWYFAASGQSTMPFAVLLEAALQPCGFLAAYLGSALLSEDDLHFRNLDGHGTQLREVRRDAGTLTTRARLTKASQAGGMILQEFDLEVAQGDALVYTGKTGFGFFPGAALAAQVGLRGAEAWTRGDDGGGRDVSAEGPAEPEAYVGMAPGRGLALPRRVLGMIDRVALLDRDGGPAGLGLVAGEKRVDAGEWFFRAHFYQDPVMPGSLGLEALLELAKHLARAQFPLLVASHRFQAMALGQEHRWQYRGQVIPTNRLVRVEGRVTRVVPGDEPVIVLSGQLAVDGKLIYAMRDFAVRLVREGE